MSATSSLRATTTRTQQRSRSPRSRQPTDARRASTCRTSLQITTLPSLARFPRRCEHNRSTVSSPSTTTRSVPTPHPKQSRRIPSSTFLSRHRLAPGCSVCPPTVRTRPSASTSATCAPAPTRFRSPATTGHSPIVRSPCASVPNRSDFLCARRRALAQSRQQRTPRRFQLEWTRCSWCRRTAFVSCGVTPTRRR